MTLTTTSPNGSDDIFSISDQGLADSYKFIEEIGFGNWGSVWLCESRHPIPSNDPPFLHDDTQQDNRVAVKIVHRNKTPTTSARVRSLWNEMKIVRSFKYDPHPSIIPFYNFIITPSYALITMKFLPRLIPVEVPEPKARIWCRSLVSGVDFLHKRGIVHNDIKPANILLTGDSPPVPVLVDFGFAEKYDTGSKKAFISNLAYGTPEYLSPERARGLPHDTRKSDVWSLGVTLFEILVGRTPFEYEEGETFATKEDLERYWTRTLKGKWLGEWKFSPQFEKVLKKMLSPNADLRCTARQAFADPYFVDGILDNLDGDTSLPDAHDQGGFLEKSLPWGSPSSTSASKSFSRTGLFLNKDSTASKSTLKERLSTFATKVISPTGPRIGPSEATTRQQRAPSNKENDNARPKSISRKPVPPYLSQDIVSREPDALETKRSRRALGDVTNVRLSKEPSRTESRAKKLRTKSVPKIGVFASLEEQSDLSAVPESPATITHVVQSAPEQADRKDKRRSIHEVFNFHRRAPSSPVLEEASPSTQPTHTKAKKSWKDLSAIMNASKSSLPAVHQAARNVQMATENRLDRMTIWIRSVEETVEGARRNLESGSSARLPPLPPCPGPVQRPKQIRNLVAADKIFRSSTGPRVRSSNPGELADRADEVKRRSVGQGLFFPPSSETIVDDEETTRPSFSVEMVTAFETSQPDQNIQADNAPGLGRQTVTYPPPEFEANDQYERIILNTSCVKRVGMGYQSNIGGPVESPPVKKRRSGLFFNTMRKPVSIQTQDTHRRTASVDELGLIDAPPVPPKLPSDDAQDKQGTVGIMQRAVRAVLGATTHSRRKSKVF